MIDGLTIKQKNFADAYFSSGKVRQSYKAAYDCESDNTASIEGTKLLKNPKIQAYIQNLNKPIIENIQTHKLQQIDFIKDRISICIENNDESSTIKYTDMLNKIYGVYKEQDDNITNKNVLDNLDISELHNILN